MTFMLFLTWVVPFMAIGFYIGFSYMGNKMRAKIKKLSRQIAELENPAEMK